jgi:hypothetical protein
VKATDANGAVVDAAAATAARGFVGVEGPSVDSVVFLFSIIAWAIE